MRSPRSIFIKARLKSLDVRFSPYDQIAYLILACTEILYSVCVTTKAVGNPWLMFIDHEP